MSDNFLRLIPVDPTFVPEAQAARAAARLLRMKLPEAGSVEDHSTPDVRFIDAGGNSESIACPCCSKPLDLDWWSQAMDDAYGTQFRNLQIETPCCECPTTLNDLKYDWPAGFARFVLEAENPGVPALDEGTLTDVERLLGCRLRIVWSHY